MEEFENVAKELLGKQLRDQRKEKEGGSVLSKIIIFQARNKEESSCESIIRWRLNCRDDAGTYLINTYRFDLVRKQQHLVKTEITSCVV